MLASATLSASGQSGAEGAVQGLLTAEPIRPAQTCPHGCSAYGHDRLLTVATGVTVVRTVLCVTLGMAGIARSSGWLLLLALAAYWIGDIADGAIARRRDEETLTGAVLDICADRLCVAVVYIGYVAEHPDFTLPLAVYLVEFMLVDSVLSLAFLRWPIAGPNYFGGVDRLVWLLNWWPPAKLVNSAVPALLSVWMGSPTRALVVAAALLTRKSACLVRVVHRLGVRGERCEGHPT